MKIFFKFLIVGLVFISCQNNEIKLRHIKGNAIGTTFSISYLDSLETNHRPKIDSIIAEINKSTSTYISTSDISKINRGDSTIVIDKIFRDVFTKSKRIFNETDGAFDPTVGILVNAWGFGPKDPINNLDSTKINELMKYVGFEKVTLNNNRIKKQHSEIFLDFNAIGKGYLIDVVGNYFEENKIENYLIEIGGEIRARGLNLNNELWKIGIENPNSEGDRSIYKVISLNNESLATSGNYRKFRISDDGKKYVHTINPKTGCATESNLLSVSVISKTGCAVADAYATAFMVMGLKKTKEFLENHKNLKAYLIYQDNDEKIKTYSTSNFDD